ncbi:hypothetical protein LOS8367_03433 [Limimaricola soesokkakensis]|uniref:Uncharacterized protein n=1 Tax=Limimaricola soesokkakensis TaxID=1343159 RepID=A0A1X7A2B3_9RHOB|nr:hypothetical protein LOS8367_03433 [Limimaricola soesokkakensis]
MGAERLIFHLGDFKTGSTAIQDWLALEGAGHGLALMPGAPHVPLAQCLRDRAWREAEFVALARHLQDAPAPVAVVSAEHFEFADPNLLLQAVSAHLPGWTGRIGLVAYVRPHPQALLSRYTESVKIGSFIGTPSEYLDWPQTRSRMAYAMRFGRWRAAWGSAFDLRLYDRTSFPGADIRRDFAQIATGRDPGPLAAPDVNRAPGLRALALARAFHQAIGETARNSAAERARWTLGRELGRLMAQAPELADDPRLELDQLLARRIEEVFAADAESLDAGFFETAPMVRALQAASAEAPAETPVPDPDTELIPETRMAVSLWGRLLARGLSNEVDAVEIDRIWHE